MYKSIFITLSIALFCTVTLQAAKLGQQNSINTSQSSQPQHWNRIPDVAQYKKADWSNFEFIVSDITPCQAMQLADCYPEITYFFFVKGELLALEDEEIIRVFGHGDAVFFSGEPWWGSAKYLADGYNKNYTD